MYVKSVFVKKKIRRRFWHKFQDVTAPSIKTLHTVVNK
jgi:hypothetical protein